MKRVVSKVLYAAPSKHAGLSFHAWRHRPNKSDLLHSRKRRRKVRRSLERGRRLAAARSEPAYDGGKYAALAARRSRSADVSGRRKTASLPATSRPLPAPIAAGGAWPARRTCRCTARPAELLLAGAALPRAVRRG